MKTNTTLKKAWQTPQVFDLDVQNTNSGVNTGIDENLYTAGPPYTFCAPSS